MVVWDFFHQQVCYMSLLWSLASAAQPLASCDPLLVFPSGGKWPISLLICSLLSTIQEGILDNPQLQIAPDSMVAATTTACQKRKPPYLFQEYIHPWKSTAGTQKNHYQLNKESHLNHPPPWLWLPANKIFQAVGAEHFHKLLRKNKI